MENQLEIKLKINWKSNGKSNGTGCIYNLGFRRILGGSGGLSKYL